MFPVKMNVLETELSAGRDLNPTMACWMEAYNPTVMFAAFLTAESSTVEGSPGTLGKARVATVTGGRQRVNNVPHYQGDVIGRIDEPLKMTTFGAAPSFSLTSAKALAMESVSETSTVIGTKPSFWRGFLDPTAT